MLKQRTLVVFKPDVLQRQIVGEILSRFERKGFKIVGMKMVWPTEELAGKHYAASVEQLTGMGNKTIAIAKEKGETLSETDPMKIGAKIRDWNIQYLAGGPVIAFVFQGPHIIEIMRKMIGSTSPLVADVGTIRADYSPDSIPLANWQERTTRNMIHASDSEESANREIYLWFNEDELYEYETAMEKVFFDVSWGIRNQK